MRRIRHLFFFKLNTQSWRTSLFTLFAWRSGCNTSSYRERLKQKHSSFYTVWLTRAVHVNLNLRTTENIRGATSALPIKEDRLTAAGRQSPSCSCSLTACTTDGWRNSKLLLIQSFVSQVFIYKRKNFKSGSNRATKRWQETHRGSITTNLASQHTHTHTPLSCFFSDLVIEP